MSNTNLRKLNVSNKNDYPYVKVGFSGRAYPNTNTFHTFDCVFGHVVKHMENWVAVHTDIKLIETEIVQRLPEAQRTKDSLRKMLARSIFPRAVALYNIDPNHEKFVDFANMDRFDRINGNPAINLLEVRRQSWKKNPGDPWDYMRDIDLMLFGSPKFQTASIFFSVLVNEEAKAYEVSEMMKYIFPLEVPKPIFYKKEELPDGKNPLIIPYTLETVLPDALIHDLKVIFNIDKQGTDGDLQLLEILRQHAKDQIDYRVDGGNRRRSFVIKYSAPITLIPKSIEEINIEESNVKTFGTKIEFLVNYPKFLVYGLSATMEKINLDDKALQQKMEYDPDKHTFHVEIYSAMFTQFTDNKLSLFNMTEVEYSKEDERIDNKGNIYTALDTIDTVCEDMIMAKYVEFLYECYDEEDLKDLIYIECKRQKLDKGIKDYVSGMEADFRVNADEIIDLRGKEGRITYIALYLNKEHFARWKEEKGYVSRSNFSNV